MLKRPSIHSSSGFLLFKFLLSRPSWERAFFRSLSRSIEKSEHLGGTHVGQYHIGRVDWVGDATGRNRRAGGKPNRQCNVQEKNRTTVKSRQTEMHTFHYEDFRLPWVHTCSLCRLCSFDVMHLSLSLRATEEKEYQNCATTFIALLSYAFESGSRSGTAALCIKNCKTEEGRKRNTPRLASCLRVLC